MNTDITLNTGKSVTIRKMDEQDIPSIMELQESVIDSLTDRTFLQPLSEEEFLFILQGNGLMIGAYDAAKLIAFRAMLEPEIDEDHLGWDAGLAESELSSVLYSEVSNVHPDYRGHSLQRILGNVLMKQIDRSRHRYIVATVAPFNIASLKDKFSLGMYIISLKEKYGGLIRYTFLKDLKGTEKTEAPEFTVDMDDILQQQEFMRKGLIGIRIKEEEGKWKVIYC